MCRHAYRNSAATPAVTCAQTLLVVLALNLAACGGGGGAGGAAAPAAPPVAVPATSVVPTVFIGTGPANPRTIYQLVRGDNPLTLSIATGSLVSSAAQTVCSNASGDEICGYQLKLVMGGALTIASFTPAVGADIVWRQPDARTLLLNHVSTANNGEFGTRAIGNLVVNSTGVGELQLDSSSQSVNAKLEVTCTLTNDSAAARRLAESI